MKIFLFIIFYSYLGYANDDGMHERLNSLTSSQTVSITDSKILFKGRIDKNSLKILWTKMLEDDEEFASKLSKLNPTVLEFLINGLAKGSLTLENFPKKDKYNQIEISSLGGDGKSALLLAKFIEDLQLSTLVNNNGFCFSACSIVFSFGRERLVGENALFMYHRGDILYSNGQKCTDFLSRIQCEYLIRGPLNNFINERMSDILSYEAYQKVISGEEVYIFGKELGKMKQTIGIIPCSSENECNWLIEKH